MFNDSIENLDNLTNMFDIIYGVSNSWDQSSRLVLKRVDLEQPEYDPIYCLDNEVSYCYRITASFLFDGEPRNLFFSIPKQYESGFIYGSKNTTAKYKIQTNIGLIRNIFKSYKFSISDNIDGVYVDVKSGIVKINGTPYSLWDYNVDKEYCINHFKLNRDAVMSNKVRIDKGLPQAPNEIHFDEKVIMKLEMMNKIKYIDEDSEDKHSTEEILNAMILLINQDELVNKPTLLDIEFMDIYDGLIKSIQANRYATRNKINNKLRKGTLTNTDMQNLINNYFSSHSDQIQTAINTNPITNASQANKIYFYDKFNGHAQAIDYNEALYGVVCPVKTIESANINVKNELAIGTEFIDGKLMVKVFNRDNEIVNIDTLEFMKSVVLCSESYDYDAKRIINVDGMMSIIFRGKVEQVPIDEYGYDYIVMENGEFSAATSNIPMVNSTDSVRALLGSHMTDQAVPVVGHDRSIIYTAGLKTKVTGPVSPTDGVVETVEQDYIIISDADGNSITINRPRSHVSTNHTYNIYIPRVEIGQEVKKGDIIFSLNSLNDEGEVELGVNTTVAYMHVGYDYEDGIAVSESFIKKFAHPIDSIIRIGFNTNSYKFDLPTVTTNSDYTIDFNKLDNYGIIKEGEEITGGDILAAYLVKDYSINNKDLLSVLKLSNLYDIQLVKVPMNIKNAKVYRIDVYDPNNLAPEGLQKYKGKKGNNEFNDYELIDLRTSDSTEDFVMDIHISNMNIPKLGDKFTNEYGSKGTIAHIYKDEEMYTYGPENKPIEVIVSPTSTISRKGLSQLKSSFLGNASMAVWDKHTQLLDNDPNDEDLKDMRVDLKILLQTDIYDNYSWDQIKDLHDSTKDICAYRIKMKVIETRFDMDVLEMISHISGVPIDCKYDVYYQGRKLDNPIVIGYTRMMRLHFIVEEKSTASPVDPIVRTPVLGGKNRSVGQMIGEQELWALLSSGELEFQDALSLSNIEQGTQLLVQMLILGQGIRKVK